MKIFALVILVTSFLINVAAHEIIDCDQCCSPDKIVLAFDMHHTLIKPDIKTMIEIALHEAPLKIAKLLTFLPFDLCRYLITGNETQTVFIHTIYTLGFKSAGDSYKKIILQYDPQLWQTAEKMATSMIALAGIEELLKELKSLGYTLRVATNASFWELDGIRQKMPQIFQCFEKSAQTVNSLANSPKKPDLAYFTEYLKKFDSGKEIIFIDDAQENVDAAKKAGMIGIVFTDAQQLRDDLIKLGIKLQKK